MKILQFVSLPFLFILMLQSVSAQTTSVLPINEQTDFVQLHKFVYAASANHYQTTSSTINTDLFATYGEYSVYLSEDGAIVFPDTIPQKYENLVSETANDYDLTAKTHLSIRYSNPDEKIALFKSSNGTGNSAISWQSFHFRQLFDKMLPENGYTIIDEETFSANKLSDSIELIVFPAVKIDGANYAYYVDQIVDKIPGI